jgi:serine protease Do
MKTGLLAIVLFLLGCAHIPTANQLNRYYESTVIVKVLTSIEGQEPTGWSGTGFSISNDADGGSTILTNKHVCAAGGSARYVLTNSNGKKISATFDRVSPQADLCLLHTDEVLKPVKMASHDIRRGEHLVVVGAPRGTFPNFTEGYASGYCPVDLSGDNFEVHVRGMCTSVPIYPGNSGSPTFNDDGKVVGIMFAARGDSEHMTIMVPVEVILQFLDQSNDMFNR